MEQQKTVPQIWTYEFIMPDSMWSSAYALSSWVCIHRNSKRWDYYAYSPSKYDVDIYSDVHVYSRLDNHLQKLRYSSAYAASTVNLRSSPIWRTWGKVYATRGEVAVDPAARIHVYAISSSKIPPGRCVWSISPG